MRSLNELQSLSKAEKYALEVQHRVELLESLDRYDELLLETKKVDKKELKEVRKLFYRWENRFQERY